MLTKLGDFFILILTFIGKGLTVFFNAITCWADPITRKDK